MVWDQLWAEAGNVSGGLCVPCLELRLGRKLELTDFSYVPLNWHVAQDGEIPLVLRERLRGFMDQWAKLQCMYFKYTNDKESKLC